MNRYLMAALLLLALLSAAVGRAAAQALPAFAPLKPASAAEHPQLKRSVRYVLDMTALARLRAARPEAFRLALPQPNGDAWTLALAEAQPLTPTFRLTDHKGRQLKHRPALHYRGYVVGRSDAQAAVSLLDDRILVTLFTPEGNWNLGPTGTPARPGTDYILFNDRDFTGKPPHWACLSQPDARPDKDGPPQTMTESCKLLTKYFECDFQMFNDFEQDTDAVAQYVSALYNVVAMLYDREEITTQIEEIQVWTEADPYAGFENSGEVIQHFSERDPMASRRHIGLGHLLATGARGLGGVAFFHALCNETNIRVAFSNIELSYQELPFTSWNVLVVSHEMGHNLNCRHTQSCWWPGGAIDGCADVERDVRWCAQPERPRPPFQGTVMSYCHIVPGLGHNLNMGFGPLPGEVIRQYVRQSACLPEIECECHAPRAPVVTPSADFRSATLQWVAAPFARAYDVQLMLPGGTFLDPVRVRTTSHTFNNLTLQGPENVYWAQVRSVCDDRARNEFSEVTTIYWTQAPPVLPTCYGRTTYSTPEGEIEDGSGPNDYSANLDCEWLIDVPGAEYIEVEFLNVDTEANADPVSLYRGAERIDTLLDNRFSGSLRPGMRIIAGSQALIHFSSDGSTSGAGWNVRYRAVGDVKDPHCTGSQTLTEASGSISDGSASADYRDNADCRWLIAPQGAAGVGKWIDLDFTEFETEEGGDFVTLYDGETEDSPLIGQYSGSGPGPDVKLLARSGRVLVVFQSDGRRTAAGWRLHYTLRSAFNHSWCDRITRVEEPQGEITDGSGEFDYSHFAYCRWVIQPPEAEYLVIRFTEFQTQGEADLVTVYDGPDIQSETLGVFSGNSMPPVLVSNTGVVTVLFTSNEETAGKGWRLEYESFGAVGRAQVSTLPQLNLRPNPTSGRTSIEWPSGTASGQLEVFDAQGRRLLRQTFEGGSQLEIDAEAWPAGLYAVRLQTSRGMYAAKLIRE